MNVDLSRFRSRVEELEASLMRPEVSSDPSQLKSIGQELAAARFIIDGVSKLQSLTDQLRQAEALLTDEDPAVTELAQAEVTALTEEIEKIRKTLNRKLRPPDPNEGRDLLLEIRAGTGGEEAALFAGDLARMYLRYAEVRGWTISEISSSESDKGGYKELIVSISGFDAYAALKYEAGVHRVQRIPITEAQGRIHTSAVTVAVLPDAEEQEVNVRNEDLRVDVYRSSGHGGQGVNTTDSAVRITHLPTGIVVTCQDERSQHKNRARALRVLKARLKERQDAERAATEAANRKSQVGSGDRSERIRTYNFPQNRLTDHRIGLTLYKLDRIIEGDLDELIEALQDSDVPEDSIQV